MAYVSPELKAKLAPTIKAILKKYNVKGSIAVRNHSTLVLNVKSAPIDFIADFNETAKQRYASGDRREAIGHIQVNEYHYKQHFSGKAKQFLTEVITAMNDGNFDHSDSQSDYFCVGWYVNVNIGKWDKNFVVE